MIARVSLLFNRVCPPKFRMFLARGLRWNISFLIYFASYLKSSDLTSAYVVGVYTDGSNMNYIFCNSGSSRLFQTLLKKKRIIHSFKRENVHSSGSTLSRISSTSLSISFLKPAILFRLKCYWSWRHVGVTHEHKTRTSFLGLQQSFYYYKKSALTHLLSSFTNSHKSVQNCMASIEIILKYLAY